MMSANDDLAFLRRRIIARQLNLRRKQQEHLQREDRLIRRRKHQQVLSDRWRQYQLRRYFGRQLLEFYQRRYEIEVKRRSQEPKPQRKTVRFASFNHVTQMPSRAADPLPPSITRDMGIPISVQEMEDNDDEYKPDACSDDDDDDMYVESPVAEEARMLNAALDVKRVETPGEQLNGVRSEAEEGKNEQLRLPPFLDMEGLLRKCHSEVSGTQVGDKPVLDDRPKYCHSSKRKSRSTKGKVETFCYKSYETTNFDPPLPVGQCFDVSTVDESNSDNSDSRSISPKIQNGTPSLSKGKRMSSEKKRKKGEREAATASEDSAQTQEQSSDNDEMSDIFSGLKKPMRSSRRADRNQIKSISSNGTRNPRGRPKVTEEGWKVYSMDELKADQPENLNGPCPFDCSCCFV